jgi:hypothetical protein
MDEMVRIRSKINAVKVINVYGDTKSKNNKAMESLKNIIRKSHLEELL